MPGVPTNHDPAAAVPDQDATVALADALDRLNLQGAIFLHGSYTEGWAYQSVPGSDASAMLAPGSDRVLLFHLVTAGRCWVRIEDDERYWAEAGDVIVFPYGHGHTMGGTEDAEVVDVRRLLAPPPWTEMPYIEHGGGGAKTHVLCGYLTCEDPLFDPALNAFPPVFVVSPTGPAAAWVQASLDYVTGQITKVSEDRFEAPTTIVELLLQEVLKLHLSSAPASERGFVRAAGDAVVAPALALMH